MDCSTSGPPCPSPTPGACSNSCPLSRWCHLTISSSVIHLSSCLQSFPASGSFQMSQFFTSGGQSIGVSASASVLPMNTQDWSPLGWTGWISLQSKGLSRISSNTTVQKHHFFGAQLFYSPTLTSIHDYWRNRSLTRWTFVDNLDLKPRTVSYKSHDPNCYVIVGNFPMLDFESTPKIAWEVCWNLSDGHLGHRASSPPDPSSALCLNRGPWTALGTRTKWRRNLVL